MFAPPLVIYLVALRLPEETFVGAVSVRLLGGQIPQLAVSWDSRCSQPRA